jgi:hypothetical protein
MTPIDPVAPAEASNGEECSCNCGTRCECPVVFLAQNQADLEGEMKRINEYGFQNMIT